MGLKWSEVEDSGGWSVFEGGAVKTINLQTIYPHIPYMPNIVKPYIVGHYTCNIMVCQIGYMHEYAHNVSGIFIEIS